MGGEQSITHTSGDKAEGGRETETGKQGDLEGLQDTLPISNMHAHTETGTPGGFWDTYTTGRHTHSVGDEGWPWPGSCLAPLVSLSSQRSRSTNPQKWLLAHLPSTSPPSTQEETGSRNGWSHRVEAGSVPCQNPVPPTGKQVQELHSCSAAWAEGPRAEEQRRYQGLVAGKEHSTVCPRGSSLGCESRREGLPLPLRSLRIPGARAQGVHGCSLQSGPLVPGYFESWSSLAFCRIWQTSVMG